MGQRIDPSRVRVLLDLGQTKPGARDAMRSQAEVFLRRAWDDATPAARMSFETWRSGAAGDAVWTAVLPPAEGGPPPVFLLIRDQAGDVDDPALRGQIVELGAPAWDPLRRALERWDTATIVQWLGADGWRVPMARTLNTEAPEMVQQTQAQASRSTGPKNLADAPRSAPVSTVTWQQAAVGGAVGAVLVGSIFYFAGKRSGEQSPRALEGT